MLAALANFIDSPRGLLACHARASAAQRQLLHFIGVSVIVASSNYGAEMVPSMNSRRLAIAFASTALLAAQPASAADCDAIKAIFAAHASKFEDLKGEMTSGSMMTYNYAVTAGPGSAGFSPSDCVVRSDSRKMTYRCQRSFDDVESLQSAYDSGVADLGRCLVAKTSSSTSAVQQETGFVPGQGHEATLTLGTRRGNGGKPMLYLSIYALKP